MIMRITPSLRQPPARQQGVALLVALVVLLLSALVAVGAARTSLLNESLTGNMTDQQRAFAAAEALLRDAQDTVVRHLQNSGAAPATDFLPNTNNQRFLPQSAQEYNQLVIALRAQAGTGAPCRLGYCAFEPDPSTPLGNWWATTADLNAMWSLGASYGQHTGATAPGGNRALANGRFWVEVYHYSKSAATQAAPPDDRHPFVYQLTAVVRGLKPGTEVVLRSVFVPASTL